MNLKIDCIIPKFKLPLEDFKNQNFQKLCSLSNLRSLEIITNTKKAIKIFDILMHNLILNRTIFLKD